MNINIPAADATAAATVKGCCLPTGERYDTKWNFYFIYILLLMKLTNVRLSHLKFMRNLCEECEKSALEWIFIFGEHIYARDVKMDCDGIGKWL